MWRNNPEINNRFHLPGNSVSEVGERMNGGAVKEDKSPENDAIDFRKEVQDPR